MGKLIFICYVIGTLLLASGCFTGAGIISTFMPMYVGVGVIVISLISNVICQSREKGG